jgi:hypothetical protein
VEATHLVRVATSFISEPITPVDASFDPAGMARGEPGLPAKFRWRKKEYSVVAVLEQWKGHGDCRNGSGERYVRRHNFRVRTTQGLDFHLYFQRSVGRGRMGKSRWWVHSIEGCTPSGREGE